MLQPFSITSEIAESKRIWAWAGSTSRNTPGRPLHFVRYLPTIRNNMPWRSGIMEFCIRLVFGADRKSFCGRSLHFVGAVGGPHP